MATGVHSRLQTGRTNPKTPQAPWYFELPRRAWTALTPRKRLALVGGVLALVSGIVLLGQARAANAPRELYSFAVAPVELRDMARELSLVGISHELNAEQDNLLVAPTDHKRALQHLRHFGLPRARVELVDTPRAPSSNPPRMIVWPGCKSACGSICASFRAWPTPRCSWPCRPATTFRAITLPPPPA